MNLTEQSRLSLADDVTFQSMGPGEDTVILSLTSGYLFTCNDTAEAFLRAMDGRRTLGEIVASLHEQYEAEPNRLRADMLALAEQMLSNELIVAANEGDEGGAGQLQ